MYVISEISPKIVTFIAPLLLFYYCPCYCKLILLKFYVD